MICDYCGLQRGHTKDHLITRNQARRNPKAAYHRKDAKFIVRACLRCNVNKGTSLRVPPSHEHLIPELEAITGGVYAIYDGTSATLRSVVK